MHPRIYIYEYQPYEEMVNLVCRPVRDDEAKLVKLGVELGVNKKEILYWLGRDGLIEYIDIEPGCEPRFDNHELLVATIHRLAYGGHVTETLEILSRERCSLENQIYIFPGDEDSFNLDHMHYVDLQESALSGFARGEYFEEIARVLSQPSIDLSNAINFAILKFLQPKLFMIHPIQEILTLISQLKLTCYIDPSSLKMIIENQWLILNELNLTDKTCHYEEINLLLSHWRKHIGQLNLKSLNLSNTGLNCSAIYSLTTFLNVYPRLEALYLNNNALGGEHVRRSGWRLLKQTSAIETLLLALRDYRHLKTLALNNTGLDPLDSEALLEMMASLDGFLDLSFENNAQLKQEQQDALNKALGQARGRAELLGCPLPHGISPKWKDKMTTVSSAAAPATETVREVAYWKGRWETLYQTTLEMIEEFVPTSVRLNAIQQKNQKKRPLNNFEGMQLRAQQAKNDLEDFNSKKDKSALKSDDFKTLLKIFRNFIMSAELEAIIEATLREGTSSAIPIFFDLFKHWLQICHAAYEDYKDYTFDQKRGASYPSDQDLSQVVTSWFRPYFYRHLEASYTASAIISTALFNVDVPDTNRERIIHFIKEVLIEGLPAVLSAIPTVTQACSVLPLGISLALRGFDVAAFSMNTLHMQEFTGADRELAEEQLSTFHLALHKTHALPRTLFETITGKSYLNTNERLRNFYDSFSGDSDFQDKLNGFFSEFVHIYQTQLEMINSKSAALLAKACAKHLARPLMLGLFRTIPPQSTRAFISLAMQWINYIPMEDIPHLKLRRGDTISADELLRGAGLRCQLDNRDIIFYWAECKIKALEAYQRYQWTTTFDYKPNPHYASHRLASQQEVDLLKNQLNLTAADNPTYQVRLGPLEKEIAEVSWRVDDHVIRVLRESTGLSYSNIISVQNPCPWQTDKERMRSLEVENKKLREEMTELRQLVSVAASGNSASFFHARTKNDSSASADTVREDMMRAAYPYVNTQRH